MNVPRMTGPTQRVLRLLLEDPNQARYGLEICRAIDLAPGTVQPILARFEGLRWLDSNFEDLDPSEAGRPRRRYYRLTPDGAELARNALVRVEQATGRSTRPHPRRRLADGTS